jgi:hypothetical protein
MQSGRQLYSVENTLLSTLVAGGFSPNGEKSPAGGKQRNAVFFVP